MSVFKNIAKLSDKEAKTREAQFEAEMLALVAETSPPMPPVTPRSSAAASPKPQGATSPTQSDVIWPPLPTTTSPATISPVASALVANGIQISVTANGQTTQYANLESVPASVRQQIVNTWIGSPAPTAPPILNAPSVRNAPSVPPPSGPRPKTMKVAMFLNLMIPGAGQIYLGQRLIGALYALAFLASFGATIIIFVHGYFKYLSLSTGGDILDGTNLDQIAKAFPTGIISTLSAVGLVIYLASTIHLAVSRSRRDV
jgi:hypothetical protein